MRALEILLNLLMNIINTLNENGFKIYDAENKEYYISKIDYYSEEDKLIVNFKEDK